MGETRQALRVAQERRDLEFLARRVVHEVAMAITPHTPGDDHTEPASRLAAVAVLRVLVADTRSRMTTQKRAYLDALIEQVKRDAQPASSADEGTTHDGR
jgi:hypothetical protein